MYTCNAHLAAKNKKGARIEIQPRFKIQYPMKNHLYNGKRHTKIVCLPNILIKSVFLTIK
jgi:hypothetical protein